MVTDGPRGKHVRLCWRHVRRGLKLQRGVVRRPTDRYVVPIRGEGKLLVPEPPPTRAWDPRRAPWFAGKILLVLEGGSGEVRLPVGEQISLPRSLDVCIGPDVQLIEFALAKFAPPGPLAAPPCTPGALDVHPPGIGHVNCFHDGPPIWARVREILGEPLWPASVDPAKGATKVMRLGHLLRRRARSITAPWWWRGRRGRIHSVIQGKGST